MRYSKCDVAGVVVLYNSTIDVIPNIKSYIDQIDQLFVIDNSELQSDTAKTWVNAIFANAQYETNNGNKGVAFALNKAATLAIAKGYKFLLTMDDDSGVPPNLVSKMLSFVMNNSKNQIGIVSVNHSSKIGFLPFRYVLYTMTSGNLLNLSAYQHVGPFMDSLFIDHIDHEYGLRLNAQGFQVIELTHLKMTHKLGIKKSIKISFSKLSYISHSPTRIYYMSRNGFYVARKYFKLFPKFSLIVTILLIKEFIKIVLFDNNKILRIRLLGEGLKDGFFKRLGFKKRNGNRF